jgi:phage-related baseplate assembly protein
MSFMLDQVPDIDFAKKDPALIEAETMRDFELRFRALTKIAKTLAPGDPTRLLLLSGVHWVSQNRVDIDFTGKENLLKYSHGPYLDNLAALYGERTLRLPYSFAYTTLRFALSAVLPFTAMIPIGTQATSNGILIFETIQTGVIPAGTLSVDVPARSTTGGAELNGLLVGQIATLVNWNQDFALTVGNVTETAGGSGIETDDHYRERIWLAPESLSTCGPIGAYEFWAKTAHPDIIDAAVYSAPEIAGEVHLFPLMIGGELPTPEILELVYAVCNYEKVRPLNDYLFVMAPEVYEFDLELTYWILRIHQTLAAEIHASVQRVVYEWLLWQRSKVGRDINVTQLIRLIRETGAKRVEVMREAETEPETADLPPPEFRGRLAPGDIPPEGQANLTIPSPPFTPLSYHQLAVGRMPPLIHFGGFEEE